MATREQLIALFESNQGTYFSGEDIAERLSISRAAVWKAVNSLRAEGYPIDAVRNRGYCLSQTTDVLSAQGIAKYLTDDCAEIQLTVLPEVDSTNTAVRERAAAGAPEGVTWGVRLSDAGTRTHRADILFSLTDRCLSQPAAASAALSATGGSQADHYGGGCRVRGD